MMRFRFAQLFARALLITASVAIVGCASAPPAPPAPPKPVRNRVGALRADAAASAVSLELAPLQNPAVDLLRAQAERLEASGKFLEADAKIDLALTIEPENPQLWQLKAEGLLRAEKYLDAEKLAMKSYEMGAKLGVWCVRNWLVIAESRDALGDASTSQAARQRAKGCPVEALIRY